MRVLHLLSCGAWISDAYWAARVCRELSQLGHEVTLCCREGSEAQVVARALAQKVPRIETLALASGLRPRLDARDIRAIAARLDEVDIVHVHRGKEHWLAALANRLGRTRRPVVRTRHIIQPVRRHAGNRWLYRRATAHVITVTEAIRRQYLAAGLLGPDHVTTLRGGVDTEAFRPDIPPAKLREGPGLYSDAPLVGLVGGLRPMKGHLVVIDALARLAQSDRCPHVVLIGGGPTAEPLREAIRTRGLERHLTLCGYVEDVAAAMTALDIALYVPLETEGMSRVLWEYMAAGRAVIASRVGVVPEALRDGDTAVIVAAGDAAALAAALDRLLGDRELRARLGTNARRVVETSYSGARVAARLLELYRRVS